MSVPIEVEVTITLVLHAKMYSSVVHEQLIDTPTHQGTAREKASRYYLTDECNAYERVRLTEIIQFSTSMPIWTDMSVHN